MKKNTKSKEKPMVYTERRVAKGWKFFASNDFSLGKPRMTDEERAAADHAWNLAIKQAEKDGKKLKEEMARFRAKLKEDEKTNAEALVEKKYNKEKVIK